jgi:hypothetical protein
VNSPYIVKGWRALVDVPPGRERGKYLPSFQAAARAIHSAHGSVDGMLVRGGLETKGAEWYLGWATGASVYDPAGWGPMYTIAAANRAHNVWPDPDSMQRREVWAMLSAKRFLETAAACGLGIKFTW